MGEDRTVVRERLIVEALLDRRMELEEESQQLDAKLQNLRTESERLAQELEVIEEILGATPPELKQGFAELPPPESPPSMPPAPPTEPVSARPASPVKFRKGSVGSKLWPKVVTKFGGQEFGVEDVVDLLKQLSPDTKHAYESAWRLCNDLISREVLIVTSQSRSGRGYTKRFRIAERHLPLPAKNPEGIGIFTPK
jgi:hypothetical protein